MRRRERAGIVRDSVPRLRTDREARAGAYKTWTARRPKVHPITTRPRCWRRLTVEGHNETQDCPRRRRRRRLRCSPPDSLPNFLLRPRLPQQRRGNLNPGYVYQGTLTSQNVVLGPQSDPTVVVQTPPLPAGTYLVTATVPAVISGNDQIVCATVPASLGISTNDGVFGTAGNGSPGGIYGTASITDTWRVMTTGDRIDLVCNSFNYGQGTSTGSDSITALATKGITRTNS